MTIDIKEGYKKTKAGWIPEGWEAALLKKYTVSSAFGPRFSSDLYDKNGNIATLRTTDIDNEGNINLLQMPLANLDITSLSSHLLEENDIVISRSGTIGITGIFEGFNYPVIPGAFLIRFRFNQNKLNPFYIKFYFNSTKGRRQLESVSAGGVQKNLTGSSVLKLSITLPPLPEQQKIAEILSIWDKAIEHNQNLVKQLKLRKKGLRQQLLTGKTRLPGFNGDWENVKLEDVTERITKKNTELNDNVVTISAQRGFVRQEDFFKKRVASATLSGYYLIKKGDFAYNKSYSKGYPMGAFKRLNRFDKAVVTTLYICFSIKNTVDSDFMVNFFEGSLMVNNLMKIAQEGGRAHGLLNISLGDFFSLKLRLPSLEEQAAIAKVLTAADDEIKIQESYLSQLQAQKKGLMQQLLTGQKRVTIKNLKS